MCEVHRRAGAAALRGTPPWVARLGYAEQMLRVECNTECNHDGASVPGPRVIWFGARRVDVTAVLDQWYGVDRHWWKVQTAEGKYIVRLDEVSGTWELAAVVGEQAAGPHGPSKNLPADC